MSFSTDLVLSVFTGLGLAMLWQRAEPLKPVRSFVIIRLNRLHDALAIRHLPRYPIWWLKGVVGCEACLSPWLAFVAALSLSLQWQALFAIPTTFAVYTLVMGPKNSENG